MRWTHTCAGDLGLTIPINEDGEREAVVALLFNRPTGHTVFDVFAGGHPQVLSDLADALNAMQRIAAKHTGEPK